MRLWDDSPCMPHVSERVAAAMDRELERLRKEVAERDKKLRILQEAHVHLEQLLTERGIKITQAE